MTPKQVLHPAYSVSLSEANALTQNVNQFKPVFRLKAAIITKLLNSLMSKTPVIYFLAFLLSQRRRPYDTAPDTKCIMQSY